MGPHDEHLGQQLKQGRWRQILPNQKNSELWGDSELYAESQGFKYTVPPPRIPASICDCIHVFVGRIKG